MFNFSSKHDESIKNPPSDDAYPIINALFNVKSHEIIINSLSLTILKLIKNENIKLEIEWDGSYSVGKNVNEDDLKVMSKITMRIVSKHNLSISEDIAINILKTINNSKKFTLKEMFKQVKNVSYANKFKAEFLKFRKAVENENDYTENDYKDILVDSKFTKKGSQLKKDWKNIEKYLKSEKLTNEYPPVDNEEIDAQIIYGACFDIEKDTLNLRKNETPLSDFIDKDGYVLLNIIFTNAITHSKDKKKGDGIFYGANDKYSIPGGA